MHRFLALGLLTLLAGPAGADVATGSLPSDTVWYVHADLEGMRNHASGRGLYRLLEREVIVDVTDELQIDLTRQLERVTAFSAVGPGMVIVLEGRVTPATRDKVLALAALEANYEVRKHDGREYYFAGTSSALPARAEAPGDFDEATYFSFALPEKVLITSMEEQMQELLERGGRVAGGGHHAGALFVLSADRSFVQAGLRAEHFGGNEDDWNSNILRNTEQAALLLADRDGLLAIDARLQSRDARMAQSLGSVVNGLIGLQMFNEDLGPDLRELIRNTRVEVADSVLNISTVLHPDMLADLLSD